MEDSSKKIFKSKTDIFYFIAGLIFIIIVGFIIINIGTFIINAIKVVIEKHPTIAVALITGLLAFISVPVGKYFENRYTIKNQIRQERQDVYIEFLNWLIKNLLNNEISNNRNIVKELKENQNKIVIYASDKVLKAWLDIKEMALNSDRNKQGLSKEEATRYYLENEAPKIEILILAIRKELGYKNKDIKKYDILKLYINDLNEKLPLK